MVGDYIESFSRHNSDDSHDSGDASSIEEDTTSSMDSGGKEYTMDIEWTDEKHSLYLKSMEASFVDQLYNSLSALGNKENVPSTRFGSIRSSSQEQFKVLHDGFWQKINVKQPEYRGNGRLGCGSREFLKSPWIKHYKGLVKTQTRVTDEAGSEPENQVVSNSNGKKGIVICCSSSPSNLKQKCSHWRDRDQISIGEVLSFKAEVSDQNFVNEVTKGENGSSKKMKTVMNESSSTDQVVPLRKTPTT